MCRILPEFDLLSGFLTPGPAIDGVVFLGLPFFEWNGVSSFTNFALLL